MDQPGKVANRACSQLNRENENFPVPVSAWEFGFTRRVQPSRPASVCSFSTLRMDLVCKKNRNRGSQRRLLPDVSLFTESFGLITVQTNRATEGLDWILCSSGLILFAVGLIFFFNPVISRRNKPGKG